MQVLINVSAEEIKTLQNIKEIRDENDIVYCLHDLIERATAKKPKAMVRDEDLKIGHITFSKGVKVYKCGSYGEWLTRTHKCCPKCGQVVLWEE
jgi:hypothetical protein